MTDFYTPANDDYDLAQRDAARAATVGHIEANPDTAARAIRLAQVSGTPPEVLMPDLDRYEVEERGRWAAEIVSSNRALSQYVTSDPIAAQVSNDDYDVLDEVSEHVKRLNTRGFGGAFMDAVHDSGVLEPTGSAIWRTPAQREWMEHNPLATISWAVSGEVVVKSMALLMATINVPLYLLGEAFDQFGEARVQELLARGLIDEDEVEGGQRIGGVGSQGKVLRKFTHAVQDPGLFTSFGLPIANPMAMTRPARRAMGLPETKVVGREGALPEGFVGEGAKRDVTVPLSHTATVTQADIRAFNEGIQRTVRALGPWIGEKVSPPRWLSTPLDRMRLAETELNLWSLDEAVRATQMSSTRERVAEIYANFVRQQGNARVQISADAVLALYGGKLPAVDDGLLGWMPGLREQLETAASNGGNVEIPLGTWLANIDPAVQKQLRDDIVLRDDGVSINDGKFIEERQKAAEEAAAAERVASAAIRVGEDVYTGTVHSDAIDAAAKARGITPDEVIDLMDATGGTEGFVTSTGRYVNRTEAGRIAKEQDQIRPGFEGDVKLLFAEDLKPVPEPRGVEPVLSANPLDNARLASALEPFFSRVGKLKLTKALGRGHDVHTAAREIEQTFGLPEGSVQSFIVLDHVGEEAIHIQLTVRGEEAQHIHIEDWRAAPQNIRYGPNSFGWPAMKDIIRQIQSEFPLAVELTGLRVTGARLRARTWDQINPETGRPYGEMGIKLQEKGLEPAVAAHIRELDDFAMRNFGRPALPEDILASMDTRIGELALDLAGPGREELRQLRRYVRENEPTQSLKMSNPSGWKMASPPEWWAQALGEGKWERLGLGVAAFVKQPEHLTQLERDLSVVVWDEMQRLLPEDVRLKVASRVQVQGVDVQGAWMPSDVTHPIIMVSLERSANIPLTFRHEALHHLRKMGYLREQEWSTLMKAAEDLGWLKRYKIETRYPGENRFAWLEEAIAEKYAEWETKRLKDLPEGVAAIFQRMKDLFDAVKRRVKEMFGREMTWDEVFAEISSGRVKERKPGAPLDPRYWRAQALEGGEAPIRRAEFDEPLEAMAMAMPPRARGFPRPTAGMREAPKPRAGMTRLYGSAEGEAVHAERLREDTHYIDVPSADELARQGEGLVPPGQRMRPLERPPIQRQPREVQLEMPEMTRMEDRPIFERAKAMGVTEEWYRKNMELIEERINRDIERTYEKSQEEIRKRQTDQWREDAAEVRKEVVQDLRIRQDIDADAYFAKGILHGERQEGAPYPKLDPESLTREQQDAIPSWYMDRRGSHPDDVASMFGFQNAAELIDALAVLHAERGKQRYEDWFRKLVRAETDARMEQRYGKLSENIMEEMKERLLSMEQVDLLAQDVLAFGLEAGTELPITKEQMQAWARTRLLSQPHAALSSDKLLAAAGKTGNLAENHRTFGRHLEAFREKQRQFIAVSMAKVAAEVEKETRAFERLADRYNTREVPKERELDYFHFIQEILNLSGLPTTRSLPEIRAGIDSSPYASFNDFVKAKSGLGWDLQDNISQSTRLGRIKPYAALTNEEFLRFKQDIDILDRVSHAERLITVMGREVVFDAFKEAVLERIRTLEVQPVERSLAGKFFYGLMDAPNVKMEEILRDLDLRERHGPLFESVILPMVESKFKEGKMLIELGKKLGEMKGDRAWQKSLHDVITQDFLYDPYNDQLFKLTRADMINIMMNFGNRSNIEKFTRGWIDLTLKGEEAKVEALRLEARLQHMFDTYATKQDWDFVQSMWDIFVPWKEEATAMYRRMNKADPKWIELADFQTKHGTYRGGYFPVIYDQARSGMQNMIEMRNDGAIFGLNYQRATTSQGHHMERTNHFDRVAFQGTVEKIAYRAMQMIHDIAYRESIMQAWKILHDKDINAAIRKYYGQEYAKKLDHWMRRVANGFNLDEVANAEATAILRTVRLNLVKAALPGNLRTILTPDMGSWNPLLWGRYWANRSEWKALAMEKSLELPHTLLNMDRDMKELLESTMRAKGIKGLEAKIVRGMYWPMLSMSQHFRIITWIEAYHKELAKPGVTEAQAIAWADYQVRSWHGSGAEMDLPSILSGGEGLKTMTMFGTYLNTIHNRARQLPGNYRRGEWNEAWRNFWGAVIIPTLATTLVYQQWKQDDTFGKNFLKALVLGPFNNLPFWREAAGLFEGHTPRTPLGGALKLSEQTVNDIIRASEGKRTSKMFQHTVQAAGVATGRIPGAFQIGRTGQLWFDLQTGKQNPRTLDEWFRGVVHGESQLRRR